MPSKQIAIKIRTIFCFIICIFISVSTDLDSALLASERFNKKIDLRLDQILQIYEGSSGARSTVTVSLSSRLRPGHYEVDEAYVIGNAVVDKDDIEPVKLCNRCATAYFIKASEASATYAAHTGIVVWRDHRNDVLLYGLTVLPLDSPYVEDTNGDGVHEIAEERPGEQREIYKFEYGQLMRVGR